MRNLWRWIWTSGRDTAFWSFVIWVWELIGWRTVISGFLGSALVSILAWTPTIAAWQVALLLITSFAIAGLAGNLCLRLYDNFYPSDKTSVGSKGTRDHSTELSNQKPGSINELAIVYRAGIAPFEDSDRGNQSFSVGVALKDSQAITSVEDVSLRLEKLEPNKGSIPYLDFRELVFPFAETYAKQLSPIRTVNINPGQMRYFQVIFSYGRNPELCFFPHNYLLEAGIYSIGLRSTGKNCCSAYAEFKIEKTEKKWSFILISEV